MVVFRHDHDAHRLPPHSRHSDTLNSVVIRAKIWQYAEDIAEEFDSAHCLAHNPSYN